PSTPRPGSPPGRPRPSTPCSTGCSNPGKHRANSSCPAPAGGATLMSNGSREPALGPDQQGGDWSAAMPKVELDLEPTRAPERVRAAPLDFTPRRPETWPGIEPSLYEVYEVGETTALVKEGSK